jgi:hypothetical protein
MKVLCPRCNEPIDLGYLEKSGAQMAPCSACGTVVSANYKKDDKRTHWKLEFETPLPEDSGEDTGCGCGAAILILIGLLILFAMMRSDPEVPGTLPEDAPSGDVRN